MTTERSMRAIRQHPDPPCLIPPRRAARRPNTFLRGRQIDLLLKPCKWRNLRPAHRLHILRMTDQEVEELAAILVQEHGNAALNVAENRRSLQSQGSDHFSPSTRLAAAVRQ